MRIIQQLELGSNYVPNSGCSIDEIIRREGCYECDFFPR